MSLLPNGCLNSKFLDPMHRQQYFLAVYLKEKLLIKCDLSFLKLKHAGHGMVHFSDFASLTLVILMVNTNEFEIIRKRQILWNFWS